MKEVNNYRVLANNNDVEVLNEEFYADNIHKAIDMYVMFADDYDYITISTKNLYGNWTTAAEILHDGSYTIY